MTSKPLITTKSTAYRNKITVYKLFISLTVYKFVCFEHGSGWDHRFGKSTWKKITYSLNDWKLQCELLNSIKKVKNYIAKISDDLISSRIINLDIKLRGHSPRACRDLWHLLHHDWHSTLVFTNIYRNKGTLPRSSCFPRETKWTSDEKEAPSA